MRKINIGLIGYGIVGQGVLKSLQRNHTLFKTKYGVDFSVRRLCDRSLHKKNTLGLPKAALTRGIQDILGDQSLDVIIELIGGMSPAKRIAVSALSNGTPVITANKELIANNGVSLFKIAKHNQSRLYFESAVMAGIPIIKTISEGVAGNHFDGLYGIINGTCNFILSEMSRKGLSFNEALKSAQEKGYAESDPTLDINGMDSAHKLSILIFLALGKSIPVKNIYVEGISHISHADIDHAESLDLCIKLLAIAKREGSAIEARVHPTLISKDHPLASINGVLNAAFLHANPVGNILLSGEGAGQGAAASGVISDLINFATSGSKTPLACNPVTENTSLRLRKIDNIETKFYLRFMAQDKPGILSKITGVLGRRGIGINSVTQKPHIQDSKTTAVPVIMLTDFTTERSVRAALDQIHRSKIVKARPIAIRMEKLS